MSKPKQFGVAAVAGVVTGYVLEDGGFGPIQDVMDHFYPGIMTIGCAAMGPAASGEIARQLPEFTAACESFDPAKIGEFVGELRSRFGDTVELCGPLKHPSDSEIKTAFAELRK